MSNVKKARVSGILLHPTSLPSPYGIGDLGQAAYDFIDFLKASGQHLWQTLPLTPTGFGDSPYQGFSAFAGQPLLISPECLMKLGLLEVWELNDCPVGQEDKVDYGAIIPWKTRILRLAASRFQEKADKVLLEEYEDFLADNMDWLGDYALYMACKDMHEGREWLDWKEEYRRPTAEVKEKLQELLKEEVKYYYFVQFMFHKEWLELKEYANENDIEIIGDIPLFVSLDSADVWANQELFQLDSEGYPVVVAGVPPDYFSATGQLWGNPLYDWKAQKKDGFKWWVQRVRHQLKLTDYLRIDHFRGLESYWAVPYGEETAMNGKWVPGPREDLFLAFEKELGKELPIIAEDLGIIKNGPSERRRFVDMELCQLDSFYLYNLNNYNKIVNQRNKLLKDMYMNPDLRETLNIWDMQLVSFGSKIIERRRFFVEQLNEIIYEIHKTLSGDREELVIHYEPDVEIEDFERKLRMNQDRDMKAKITSVGPHRDDFSFMVGDVDIRKFGSQGQQRTAALSLKLSEIELVKKITQDTPILLLDDVLSELDSNRQNYLLNSIGDIQTIITCTGLEEFVNNRFELNKVYKVTEGTVTCMSQDVSEEV